MERIISLLTQVIEELLACSPPIHCRDKITDDFVRAGEQAAMISNVFAELLHYNMSQPDYHARGSKAMVTALFLSLIHI